MTGLLKRLMTPIRRTLRRLCLWDGGSALTGVLMPGALFTEAASTEGTVLPGETLILLNPHQATMSSPQTSTRTTPAYFPDCEMTICRLYMLKLKEEYPQKPL